MRFLFHLLKYQARNFRSQIDQWIWISKLRTRIRVGKYCSISKDLVVGKGVRIKSYVNIGDGVQLGDGVTIGANASLSKVEVGRSSEIESGVRITGNGKGKITIGENSYIGIYNILDWSDDVVIGNYVHIAGPSTGLWTHSSARQAHAGIPLKNKNTVHRPVASIKIEDYVYIGGNCTIYPGVSIGHHAIIAPNSAVSKNVNAYEMVGGVPAKSIKYIDWAV